MAIADFTVEPDSFALAACIGATHAYDGYRNTLRAFRNIVRSRGQLLIGEGYWKCDPHPDYLSILGASKTHYTDHAGNVAIAIEEGLIPLEQNRTETRMQPKI